MRKVLLLVIEWERNWVFATNSDFLASISLRPDVVDLRYSKIWTLFDQIVIVWNQRFTTSGCKDIGIRKFEFEAKSQFLFLNGFCSIRFKRLFDITTHDRQHANIDIHAQTGFLHKSLHNNFAQYLHNRRSWIPNCRISYLKFLFTYITEIQKA